MSVEARRLDRTITQLEQAVAELRAGLAPPLSASEPPAKPPSGRGDPSTLRTAMFVQRARRRALRDAGEHVDLFCDPAWAVLLDLYVTEGMRGQVSVSGVCATGEAPPTTVLRWLTLLEKRGLLAKVADPFDRRRRWLHLTTAGRTLVERLLPEGLDQVGVRS